MRSALLIRLAFALLPVLMGGRGLAAELPANDAAALVRALVDAPPAELSFGKAKLEIDKFADPSIDEAAALAELDQMAATIEKMIATLPAEARSSSLERMKALRAFLYEPGWWNGGKPFRYDLSDPFGQKP